MSNDLSTIPDSYWNQCDICDEKKLQDGYFIGHMCKICASCYFKKENGKLSKKELNKLIQKLPCLTFTSSDGGVLFTQPRHVAECNANQLF